MSRSPRVNTLLWSVWIVVLGAGGAWLGTRMASRNSVEIPAILAARGVPEFLQASVATLPTAQLMGDENFPVNTADILGTRGTVVLFLDMDCDPCRFAASQWQEHRNSGEMGDVEVVAITPSSREGIASFKRSLDLTFPIYQDQIHAYVTRYGIDTFPWQVVVDSKRNVVSYTGNLSEMGSLEALGELN